MSKRKPRNRDYDVCLSFAGEDRKYVNQVAALLDARGIRVFYDKYDQVSLWGKNLYEHLDYIYREAAQYCIVFVSKNYAKKIWTNHERQSAQARAIEENREYVLPAIFDDTKIAGMRGTVGYIDLRKLSPKSFVDIILKKLEPLRVAEFQNKSHYVPPVPDKLYREFKAKSAKFKRELSLAAHSFQKSLARLDERERFLVLLILSFGCTHDIKRDVHIELDLLRRLSGVPRAEIEQLLSGISSVGFGVKFRAPKKGAEVMAHLTWHGRHPSSAIFFVTNGTSETAVAWSAVWLVRQNYCEEHGLETLMKLNFSPLSKATTIAHKH
jgi:TIR domain